MMKNRSGNIMKTKYLNYKSNENQKGWCKLRENLKSEMVKVHIAVIHEAHDSLMIDEQASSEDAANNILRQLECAEPGPGGEAGSDWKILPELATFHDDHDFIMSVHQGWTACQSAQLTLQPHYLSMMHSIGTDLAHIGGEVKKTISVERLLTMLAPHMLAIFTFRWSAFGATLLQLIADCGTTIPSDYVEQISAGIFNIYIYK